jgi:uncharacterized membrane protein YhaH (DUF805 family)
MITAIETCLQKFLDFSGRATRSEFWYFYLFWILADLVLSYSNVPFVDKYGSLVFLPAVLAAATRRLHDAGRSGWWLWVPLASFVFLCTPSVNKD